MQRASILLSLSLCAALFAPPLQAQTTGGNPEAKALKNPVASNAESIANGGKLYQKLCAFCHGPKGLGDGKFAKPGTKPANLVDATWASGSSDGEIFMVIMNGLGPKFDMPALKGRASATDIWHIVNYLRSINTGAK